MVSGDWPDSPKRYMAIGDKRWLRGNALWARWLGGNAFGEGVVRRTNYMAPQNIYFPSLSSGESLIIDAVTTMSKEQGPGRRPLPMAAGPTPYFLP